jgi:hypothetical protein
MWFPNSSPWSTANHHIGVKSSWKTFPWFQTVNLRRKIHLNFKSMRLNPNPDPHWNCFRWTPGSGFRMKEICPKKEENLSQKTSKIFSIQSYFVSCWKNNRKKIPCLPSETFLQLLPESGSAYNQCGSKLY